MIAVSPNWISTSDLAAVAAISDQKARRALARAQEGLQWRGCDLVVSHSKGKGGSSGLSYLVRIDSLPPDLRQRAEAMFGDDQTEAADPLALPAPALGTALSAVQNQTPLSLPAISASTAAATRDWEWKREIIHPAMILPKGSPERGAMIKELASTNFIIGGERKTFGESTLRSWMTQYEEKGLAGLCRKPRSDRGEDRVVISRTWDEGVSLSQDAKAEIAAKLVTYVKSVWANAGGGKGKCAPKNGGGWRICSRFATKELIKLTRAAGLELPTPQLLSLCEVPRSFVEHYRNYAIVALKNNDAKAFADTAAPRTRRTRLGMVPMELVVGDVHHLDIYLRREDGSLYTPKIIAWYDLATNRTFATLVFVEKGKGIRQEDVIKSFIDMTQHQEWGMPQGLYLDNGGEYAKLGFIDDAMKLAALPQCHSFRLGGIDDARRRMVVKAQPYNAPAKPIEGNFAVLESGPLALISGWIGGNRMKAKTKNVGKEPTPFPRSDEEFREAFATAMEFYHTNVQRGSLKGKSPRAAFTAAVELGWKRTDVDPMALHAVFAIEEIREVTQGEFRYNNAFFTAPELLSLLPGTKVRIRIPIVGDKNRITVLDDDGHVLCIAEPAQLYGFLNSEGAKDRGRRIGIQRKAIAAMGREVEDLNLVEEAREATELHPAALVPESGGTIRLSDEMDAIAQAAKQLPASRAQAQDAQMQERFARRAALARAAAAG